MFDQLQNYRLPDATSDGHHRSCQMFSFVCVGFNSIHSFVAVVGMTHLSRELSMSCPGKPGGARTAHVVLCALTMNATSVFWLFQYHVVS